MDSVILNDSIFIQEQRIALLNMYSANDSILNMTKNMNKHIKNQKEIIDQLKTQRKFLIGGIILETVLLILIGLK